MSTIEFNNVVKRYPGGQEALSCVDFTIESGEMVFLTGHSGAGKSTLLKLISLLDTPSSGAVLIGGQDLSKIKRRRIPYYRRQIGFIFQNHRLLYDRTVADNVALPMIIAGLPQREINRRVSAALEKVGLLNKEMMNPIALSGGEQQRVGIARAVVNRPPILMADEPTGNLDPALSAEIMKLFGLFNQIGVTVLIATHDLALVKRSRKRVLTLDQGKLVAS